MLLLAAGCAKVGEPQPPVLLIPAPASDLTARQVADRIALSVSLPERNTNGSSPALIGEMQLLRLTEPAGRISTALPEDLYLKQAVRVLTVPSEEFAGYLRGKTLVFTDSPSAAGGDLFGRSFDYAVMFLNRKNQAAGLGNQAIISPLAIPGPPGGLSCEVRQHAMRLTWIPPAANSDGSVPPRIAGYNVYRSENPKEFPSAPLNPPPLTKPEFEDRSFLFDKTYYYAVSVVGKRENPYAESGLSAPVKVVARDVFPPGPPLNLNSVVENGLVILLWAAPQDTDVAGYRVYRSEEGSTEKRLLQPAPVTAMSYKDGTAQPGRTYIYSVTAVDTHGNESTPAQTRAEVP
jgi:hypothetical protein